MQYTALHEPTYLIRSCRAPLGTARKPGVPIHDIPADGTLWSRGACAATNAVLVTTGIAVTDTTGALSRASWNTNKTISILYMVKQNKTCIFSYCVCTLEHIRKLYLQQKDTKCFVWKENWETTNTLPSKTNQKSTLTFSTCTVSTVNNFSPIIYISLFIA